MRKHVLPYLLFLLLSQVVIAADPTVVFLVRHAEKSTQPPNDPVLAEAGKARAQELVRTLNSTAIHSIYTSQFARTRETAEPLAKNRSIQIRQIDAQTTPELAKEILTKDAGKKVLVVGHSNTLPEIVLALGGPKIAELGDYEYDTLLILFIYAPGKTSLVRLKYGDVSPVEPSN